jgi:uncharacterized protein with NRDE domain
LVVDHLICRFELADGAYQCLISVCTLVLYFKVFKHYPVVIGANRDEFFSRPSFPPCVLGQDPEIVGGKDGVAGGTWLGLNAHGLVCGLLNRRSESPLNPRARSRGLLCLDALHYRTPAQAARYVSSEPASAYNPFNLLLVSRDAAMVCSLRGGQIEVTKLAPGLHMLTNLDINDFECPKISRVYKRFAALRHFTGDPSELTHLLADHDAFDPILPRSGALCVHLEDYGTRSASVILLGREVDDVRHFFADGPPCRTTLKPALTPACASVNSAES